MPRTPGAAEPDMAERIGALPALPIGPLRELWRTTFGAEPLIANRRFLERRIAYHWQAVAYEATHSGVLAAQRARIAALTAQWEAAQKKPVRTGAGLAPGTVLIREFNSIEHEVRVAAVGVFEYAGQRFASLSEVARQITGTRWSGPRFFGLRARHSSPKP